MAQRGFGRFIQEDLGQDLVEYALLMAFVSLGSLVAVQSLGPVVNARYSATATELSTGGSGGRSGAGNAGGGAGGNGNSGNNGNHGNGNNGNGNGNNGHAGS